MKDDVILICKIIFEPIKDSWNRFKALFPICCLMGILLNLSFSMISNVFSQAILIASILSTSVFFIYKNYVVMKISRNGKIELLFLLWNI